MDFFKLYGVEIINFFDGVLIEEYFECIIGYREVDCVIDYVGVDCCGFGVEVDKIVESVVINVMFKYVCFGGMISMVGVYCVNLILKDLKVKKGYMDLEWFNVWIKLL